MQQDNDPKITVNTTKDLIGVKVKGFILHYIALHGMKGFRLPKSITRLQPK